MHIDPILPIIVSFVLVILAVTFLMRFIRQPYVIAYLIAGGLLGPHGFGLFEDEDFASHIGSVGVMLLLFFVGMEVSMPRLLANWRVALFYCFDCLGASQRGNQIALQTLASGRP